MSAKDPNYIPNPENDKIWFDLGHTFGILKYKYELSRKTILNRYGYSHKMTNNIRKINFNSISSTLDNMVCGSYPFDIHSIILNEIEVKLINIFYNFPNSNTNIPYINTPIKYTRYEKTLLNEDKEYIEEFIAHLRYFLIEIHNIDLIAYNKNYSKLKKNIIKLVKYIDLFEALFNNAEIVHNPE